MSKLKAVIRFSPFYTLSPRWLILAAALFGIAVVVNFTGANAGHEQNELTTPAAPMTVTLPQPQETVIERDRQLSGSAETDIASFGFSQKAADSSVIELVDALPLAMIALPDIIQSTSRELDSGSPVGMFDFAVQTNDQNAADSPTLVLHPNIPEPELPVMASLQPAAFDLEEGEEFSFVGSFTDPGILDTHTIRWNFGDGVSTNNVLNPSHAYKDNGVYSVTLDVTDKDGDVGSASVEVLVSNVAPTADLGPSKIVSEGEIATYVADVNDPGEADTHSFSWTFDPGLGTVEGNSSMTHSFPDEGIFVVSVDVTDDDGGATVATTTVHVVNEPPVVEAGADQTVDEGTAVVFAGSFQDPGPNDTHIMDWDFGDGIVVTGSLTPTHTFQDNGTYTVTLTVSDNDGGTATDSLTIKVLNKPPLVEIGP